MADAPSSAARDPAVATAWWLALARLPLTTLIRTLAPLLATIAAGVGVSLVTAGLILAVFELAGFSAPLAGALVDRLGARRALRAGLAVFAVAMMIVAVAPNGFVLAPALLLAGLGANVYEAAAVVWLAGITAFGGRAAVLGRYELSWAGGLLVGVPVAGVLALVSWRLVFAVLAVAALVARTSVARRLGAAAVAPPAAVAPRPPARPRPPRPAAAATGGGVPSSRRHVVAVFAGFGVLCGASSVLLVVSGVWLDRRHGLSTAAIGAVGFALGAGDLAANLASVRFTDRVGKARGTVLGAAALASCAAVLALGHGGLVSGIALLVCCTATFEFALLSCKPLLTELGWANPGLGVGIGFASAALCRAGAAVAGTALYDAHGLRGPAAASAVAAIVAAGVIGAGVVEPAHERHVTAAAPPPPGSR